MSIDLLTPAKKGAALNATEGGTNLDAIESAINGIEDGSISVGNAVKLAGKDSSAYMQSADYIGAVGNIIAPLTWFPFKKNLLTQQGQNICTFTRAGTATCTDRYGVLKSAAADTARFNENGLLLEGASTNMITYSEQFDNAAWAKTRATVSANTTAVTDPYGTNLADKLTEDSSASASHYVNQNQSFTAGATYAISVFAKKAERDEFALQFPSSAFGSILSCVFNLSTVTCDAGGVIEALANGWYRCSFTAQATLTSSGSPTIILRSGNSYLYTGDGISGIYLFGAQLEAIPFATSYIPTISTPLSRTEDVLSLPSLDNIVGINKSVSIVCDFKLQGLRTTTNQALLYFSTNAYVRRNSDNQTSAALWGTSANVYSSTDYVSSTRRIAVIHKSGSQKMYEDGQLIHTASIGGYIYDSVSNIYIGRGLTANSQNLYGYVSNFRIYDRAFTAQEVMAA